MIKENKLLYSDNEISLLEMTILRCFFPEGTAMTIKQVRERCGYSYERVNTALKKLENKKIVSLKTIGKTLVYDLNFKKLDTYMAFIMNL
jgi:predicted transcriptional regulator